MGSLNGANEARCGPCYGSGVVDGEQPVEFVCDDARHLICVPFSVENLHVMAEVLGIKRCWFHSDRRHPHYDIPKKRIAEITAKCRVVETREIVAIMKGSVTHGADG